MTLYKGQRIFFRGLDGEKRARDFANEFDAKVEGPTVTLKRDMKIGEKLFTRADIFGADLTKQAIPVSTMAKEDVSS